jgi:DNA-binding transcriptional MocR family regulator
MDRNARARLIYLAEALDRRTHQPGRHGGVLKRTGLAVLKALIFCFLGPGGRCDPSLDSLAQMAGCARSTVAEALKRLEAAGLVRRIARWRAVAANGGLVVVQLSNAYLFPLADAAQRSPETGSRSQSTTYPFEQPKSGKTGPCSGGAPDLSARVHALLAVLGRRERRLGLVP